MAINGASRLPGGVGTRHDVALLISYSSYVKQPVTDMVKWNSVVSAALDRLQLVADPPVKCDFNIPLFDHSFPPKPL